MRKAAKKTEAGQQYAMAHASHYTTKDQSQALGLYRAVMDAHPEPQETEYSRAQIQNIISSVVPKQELFGALAELPLVHVAHGNSASIVPNPDAPNAADSLEEAT